MSKATHEQINDYSDYLDNQLVLDEVINYYNNSKTDVYMMMLDASKAFDRVDHIKLFKILSKKGVCPTLLKLLFNMYIVNIPCLFDGTKWYPCLLKQVTVLNKVEFCLLFY